MIRWLMAFALVLPAAPAQAQDSAAGEWRDEDSFEKFHGLLLQEDGTFLYALSVGALDQRSQGSWVQQASTVTLTTAPVPVPPEFRPEQADPDPDAPLVQVDWAHGGGVALIDVTVGCGDGTIAAGYTQLDGWSPPDGECPDPQWLELVEPVNDIRSPRYALAGQAGERSGGLHIVLEPNDFGVVDLTGTTGILAGDRLELLLRGYSVTFVRHSEP